MSKFIVNDFVTATCSDLNEDCEYSFGQVISIKDSKYTIKFIDDKEFTCDIKIIDSIIGLIPTKIKKQLENPYELYDFVEDCTSYNYFCEIQKNPTAFMDSKIKSIVSKFKVPEKKQIISHIIEKSVISSTLKYTQSSQVWVSKCRHGKDCERLGCEKCPEFCPHGDGCERLACKAMYY
jgi:hypothetical protein